MRTVCFVGSGLEGYYYEYAGAGVEGANLLGGVAHGLSMTHRLQNAKRPAEVAGRFGLLLRLEFDQELGVTVRVMLSSVPFASRASIAPTLIACVPGPAVKTRVNCEVATCA